jgi:tetratricopeptide (TPR) repeat protein
MIQFNQSSKIMPLIKTARIVFQILKTSIFLFFGLLPAGLTGQGDPLVLYNRGTELAIARDFKGAIEAFDEAIRLDPNLYYAYAGRAAVKAEQGNYKAALADYQAYEKIVTELNLLGDPEILAKKAKVEQLMQAVQDDGKSKNGNGGKPDEEISQAKTMTKLNEAIEVNDEPRVYYYRGKLKLETNEITAAIFDFSQALLLDSGFVDAWVARGYARLKLLDLAPALNDFSRAISLDPTNYEALIGRGEVKDKQKIYLSAIDDFSAAALAVPSNHVAYFDRGLTWFHLKNFEKANEDFSMAIQLNSSHTRAYFNRAITRINLRKRTEACIDLKTASDLGHPQAAEYINRFCN